MRVSPKRNIKGSLRNLVLLICCLIYAPIRGLAKRSTRKPKRICIIQMAHFGDMICTTPMFRAVKQTYPNAQLIVIGNAINKQVLLGNPDISEYIVWENKFRAFISKLHSLNLDFAVTTGPDFVGLAVLFLAGVPHIAVPRLEKGSSPLETKPYRLLCQLAYVVPPFFTSYVPREYLRLLEPIGIKTSDTRKYVYYSPEALTSACQKLHLSLIGKRSFTIIAPGTGHKAKRWPAERFAAVAEYIVAQYMPVAVVGSESDAEVVENMMANITHPDVINFGGNLSIEELKAFVSRASLFVSGDTGPIYIAEALGIPTIDIVGPASDTAQPPIGPKNIVLVPPRKKPTLEGFNTRIFDPIETKRQAEATTIEEVTKAVDVLIMKIRHSH